MSNSLRRVKRHRGRQHIICPPNPLDGSEPPAPVVAEATFEDPTPPVPGLEQWPKESRTWHDELTRELVERLICVARVGGFKKHTAVACGVKPATLEWWLDEGLRPDADPLMAELSARFLSVQANQSLLLVDIVKRAALSGSWEAALNLLGRRHVEWNGKGDHGERDNTPAELSAAQRREMLVASLKDPRGELAQALREAGLLPEGKP